MSKKYIQEEAYKKQVFLNKDIHTSNPCEYLSISFQFFNIYLYKEIPELYIYTYIWLQ